MTRHYPDLSCAFDWLKQISLAARLIRSASQIWVVTRHQYGIFVLVSQTSFRGETSRDVAKCRLFSQASSVLLFKAFNGANKSCFPAPLKLNLVFTVAFVIARAFSVQCITWRWEPPRSSYTMGCWLVLKQWPHLRVTLSLFSKPTPDIQPFICKWVIIFMW